MSEEGWSAQDTTPDAIEAALRELLVERHAENDSLVPARVMNLIVVVDRDWKGEISNRLERVGRYHASRTVLCSVQSGRTTIDAVAIIGWDEPSDGGGSVMREQVELDLGPDHLSALDTIVDPLIVSELQTMLWCPHGHREAIEALRGMTDVVLLDSEDDDEASNGMQDAAELLHSAYVVDLAWLRTTPWRERLASTFDPPDRREALHHLRELRIRYRAGSEASALLLAGWMCSRLGWEPGELKRTDAGALRGSADNGDGGVEIALDIEDQEAPGLNGVTVGWDSDRSLRLDRAHGGLHACEKAGSTERKWQILGASRGEGGILGEGVRQALLRDPTYGPALDAAMKLCP
jgi:glucose-6-phosphate dehydrogenase assembly protein OpcA